MVTISPRVVFLAAPLAIALCVTPLFAAEPVKTDVKPASRPEALTKTVKSPILAALTYGNWWYYTNLTVPANGYLYLDPGADFSASNNVSISVQSANPDTVNLVISPYWSAPDVPMYIPSITASGANFYFNNAGGATFPVAGSQLRVFLYNRSNTVMTLQTAFIYASAQ